MTKQTTPARPTPTGLVSLVWSLLDRYGMSVAGFIIVVPVYLDLKASTERFACLVESNIRTNSAVIAQIEKAHDKVGTMGDTIRRIEIGITNLQTRNP